MRVLSIILLVGLLVTIPLLSACDLSGNSKEKQAEELNRKIQEELQKAQDEYNRQLQEAIDQYQEDYKKWQEEQSKQIEGQLQSELDEQ
jgi:predicted Holliday junction resolvase-like endonuclease